MKYKKRLKTFFVCLFLGLAFLLSIWVIYRPLDSQKPYNSYEVLLEYKPSFSRKISKEMKSRLIMCQDFGKNLDAYAGVQEKTLYLKYFLEKVFTVFPEKDDLKEFLDDYVTIYGIVFNNGDSQEDIKAGLRNLVDEYGLGLTPFDIDQTYKAVYYYITN